MSYVFRLMPAGADRNGAMDDGTFVPIDPAKEAAKLRVAQALVARYPSLEVTREGYDRGSPSRLRCYEVNDLGDDSFGVQIQLFDDEAAVTVPFWHSGDKAIACFDQVWDFLRIICAAAGYAVYDKQLKRTLADGESSVAALAAYVDAQRRVSRDPDFGGRKPPKPKWKK